MTRDQSDPQNYSENDHAFWEGCLDRLQALIANDPPLKKQNSPVGDDFDSTHKENKQ